MNAYLVKGNLISSRTRTELFTMEQGYLYVADGRIRDICPELPEELSSLPLHDFGDAILIPGMVDLHLHAPQFSYRGTHMDEELLQWLEKNTFPEEARYRELSYAERGYRIFTEALKESMTTRAVIFATLHVPATLRLMELLEESGLCACVGKVNMDRNSPEYLTEHNAEESLRATEEWLEKSCGRFPHIRPILTPRFTPSCSDALMEGLGKLKEKYQLDVQSHISENPSEVEWVKELCPWSGCYGDTYRRWGLLPHAVMAHAVYSSDRELRMMREAGSFIAHCPQSNTNLASGIAPIRKYLDGGMRLGLGTDIAGGANLSMFRAITDAIAVSKLRWRLADREAKPLSFPEAFYLATAGGGAYFGKAGKLEKGYEADVLVLKEEKKQVREMTLEERLEQMVYLDRENTKLLAKYVGGERVL